MKDSAFKVFLNGLIKENPIFVLILGMCPTLATTTSAINGMSMGLATLFVLFGSNVAVSLVKNFIPDKVRIPAYVVVIATFVSVAEMLIHAYFPVIYDSLGIFIPLIVVNCIVLGRAEAFAAKNTVFRSALDGLGMGLGFTFALTLLGRSLAGPLPDHPAEVRFRLLLVRHDGLHNPKGPNLCNAKLCRTSIASATGRGPS